MKALAPAQNAAPGSEDTQIQHTRLCCLNTRRARPSLHPDDRSYLTGFGPLVEPVGSATIGLANWSRRSSRAQQATTLQERTAVYLTGSKQHTLDAKVRLTLPAEFRREFDREICIVPAASALYGFTPEGHKAWVESSFPNGFNPRSAADDKLRRFLNGQTVHVDIDSAGRIALGKIPEKIRKQFGLNQEVVIVGNDDHFEIWNPDRWQESQAAFEQDFDAIMFTED